VATTNNTKVIRLIFLKGLSLANARNTVATA